MRDCSAGKPRRLRELLATTTLVLPGAFNALSAMQIEHAGFDAIYVSGAALAAARGLPDIGLLSMTEVVSDAATIANAVALPSVADADTGFGPPLMVMRAGAVRHSIGRSGDAQEVRPSAGEATGVATGDGRESEGRRSSQARS